MMRNSKLFLLNVIMWTFGLVLVGFGIGAANAQVNVVTLKLTAPSGHPGAVIDKATFSKDGDIVGEFNGFLAVSGGSASTTHTVTEEPNKVEVTFRVPFSGTSTVYDVSSTDFAFDVSYFLPDPSLGDTIPSTTVGDEGTDAFFVVSMVEVSDDQTAPSCEISKPTGQIVAILQDTGSGLAEINVRSRNLTVDPLDDPEGTKEPVVVVGTIINPNRYATLIIKAVDEAGNRSYCKSLQRRTSRTRSR
jgi:hypothetical protein